MKNSRFMRVMVIAIRPHRIGDAWDVVDYFLVATQGVGLFTVLWASLSPPWGTGEIALLLCVLVVLFFGVAYRLQGDVDRRGEYDRVVRRLATFRLTLKGWRVQREGVDEQYERGKVTDAKEATLNRYLALMFKADGAVSKSLSELHDYIREEPLLGVSQLETLMVAPVVREGRAEIVAQGEAAELWIAQQIADLADQQRDFSRR